MAHGGSHAPACCLLDLCCRKHPDKVAALAQMLESSDHAAKSSRSSLDYADFVLTHFDLVPKGLGRSIVDAYADVFAEYHRP